MKEKLLNHKHTTPSLSDNWQSITLPPPLPSRKSLGKAVDLPSLPSWTVSRAALSQVFSHYSQPLPRNWPGMIRLAVADCSNGSKHSRPIRHYLLNILWLYCCLCVWSSGSDAVDTIKRKRWVCCMFLDSVVCVCVCVCWVCNLAKGECRIQNISILINSSFTYDVSFGSGVAVHSSNALQQRRRTQRLVHAYTSRSANL